MAQYKTVRGTASDEFTEKKSRFIGYISPAESEADALAFINEIRSRHRDASHNVFAYVIRENQIKRASDDGEPQGTGGVPVLGVIEGRGLTNVVVVVTRYFGGTLLGTGGLARAYSDAASFAVSAAETVVMAESCDIRITADYSLYGPIDRYLNENCVFVVRSDFGETVTVTVRIKSEDEGGLISDITDISCGRASFEKTAEGWNEI